MTTGRSKSLTLLCALVALMLGVAGWLFLRERTAAPAEHVSAGAAPSAAQGEAPRASVELQTPATPAADAELSEDEPVAVQSARSTAPANPAPADAIQITGRVVCPPGTPADEKIDVLASGKQGKATQRARVQPDGTFTLALAKGTRATRLELDARYLFLREFVPVRIKDGRATSEIVLEPELGACVLGQMHLPAPGLPTNGVAGSEVRAFGRDLADHESQDPIGRNSGPPRGAIVDKGLRFELHGLAPELEYDIHCSLSGWIAQPVEKLRLAAGETRAIDVNLSYGVRLRGRVIDSGATPPDAVHVLTESGPADEPPSESNGSGHASGVDHWYADAERDGTFEVKAVKPGRIVVCATATQRTEGRLDLGVLRDGDVREGLELVLGLGGQVGGRVVWPDGTPAVGAWISLTEQEREGQEFHLLDVRVNDIGSVTTDGDGRFLIQGLVRGPFDVSASADAREPAPVKKAPAPKWNAKLESVATGTLNLELTLRGGSTVTGVVVDDAGTPIERYTIRAAPQQVVLDESLAVSKSVRAADGRFELVGVSDGSFTLEVSVAKFEPPDPLGITLPGDTGPFTFVVQRPGSISGNVLLPDGAPAARARIFAIAEESIDASRVRARSGSDGQFTINSAPTGTVGLYAELAGFANSDFVNLQIAPAQSVNGIVLQLHRGARITGVVHPSHAGEPVAGRGVYCNQVEGNGHASTSTDAEGRFVMTDLAPGEYEVSLEPSLEALQLLRPAGESSDDAGRMEDLMRTVRARLEEGGEAHVVFGSAEPASVRIAGTVRRGDAPAAGMRVRASLVTADFASESAIALTDESGRYELAVVHAGKYRVEALPRSNASLPFGVDRDVPAGGLDHVDFALPTGRIAGIAHANSQLPNGQIHVLLEKSKTEHAWADTEGSWPDAQFAFDALPAGKYTIVATVWIPDSHGRPRTVFPHVRREVELSEGQDLADVRIKIEER